MTQPPGSQEPFGFFQGSTRPQPPPQDPPAPPRPGDPRASLLRIDHRKRAPLRVLMGYARPHRLVLFATLILVLASSGAGLMQPLVAQQVLTGLSDGGDVKGPVVLLGALVVAGACLTGLQSWWQQRTSERVVRRVRQDLVFRLIRLRVPELDRRPPGDLIARVTSDSTLLQNAATEGLVMIANGLLSIVGAGVLMGVVHLPLLGVTVGVLVTVGLVMGGILPRIRKAVARAQESIGEVGSALDRTLGAARTVKANGAEDRETEVADRAIEGAYKAGLVGAKYVALVKILSGVSIQAAFLAVLGVGGALVAGGDLTTPELIAFLLYVFYLASPIASLVGGLGMLQQGLGAVGRIEQIKRMAVEADVDEVPGAAAAPGGPSAAREPLPKRELPRHPASGGAKRPQETSPGPAGAPVNGHGHPGGPPGAAEEPQGSPASTMKLQVVGSRAAGVRRPPTIEFRDVRFSYPGRGTALKGISYTVPGGTQTALVGLSGAGKTTMFALLQRFYDPTAGQIIIDGVDIEAMRRAEVRRRIAYVEQDSPVMAGTLEDNLKYSATNASEEDIAEALRVTRLDALVERLPDGLRTEVGNRGVSLSGGERQRLAIARALLRKPEVLLLDEATAQLDARNEQALRDAVDQAAQRCTVILIAHRLSTVTHADQIVVLEHGEIRALGSHEELVRADGLYRELAASQMLVGEEGTATTGGGPGGAGVQTPGAGAAGAGGPAQGAGGTNGPGTGGAGAGGSAPGGPGTDGAGTNGVRTNGAGVHGGGMGGPGTNGPGTDGAGMNGFAGAGQPASQARAAGDAALPPDGTPAPPPGGAPGQAPDSARGQGPAQGQGAARGRGFADGRSPAQQGAGHGQGTAGQQAQAHGGQPAVSPLRAQADSQAPYQTPPHSRHVPQGYAGPQGQSDPQGQTARTGQAPPPVPGGDGRPQAPAPRPPHVRGPFEPRQPPSRPPSSRQPDPGSPESGPAEAGPSESGGRGTAPAPGESDRPPGRPLASPGGPPRR